MQRSLDKVLKKCFGIHNENTKKNIFTEEEYDQQLAIRFRSKVKAKLRANYLSLKAWSSKPNFRHEIAKSTLSKQHRLDVDPQEKFLTELDQIYAPKFRNLDEVRRSIPYFDGFDIDATNESKEIDQLNEHEIGSDDQLESDSDSEMDLETIIRIDVGDSMQLLSNQAEQTIPESQNQLSVYLDVNPMINESMSDMGSGSALSSSRDNIKLKSITNQDIGDPITTVASIKEPLMYASIVARPIPRHPYDMISSETEMMIEKELTRSPTKKIESKLQEIHQMNPENIEKDPHFEDKRLAKDYIVPVARCRGSERVPKALIDLSSLPEDLILDCMQPERFMNRMDTNIDSIHKIKEIYSNIFTNNGQNFFECDDDLKRNISACPPVPADRKYAMALKRPSTVDLTDLTIGRLENLVNDDGDKKAENSEQDHYEIRLMTRDSKGGANIKADEFIRNRRKAMLKVTSSRYDGRLEYNYGGYVPANVFKHNEKKVQAELSLLDYLKFVQSGTWDFVLHVVLDERADQMARQQQEEELLRLRNEEERKKNLERLNAEKHDRRKHLSEYKGGFWNPGVLDYLNEMKERDTNLILEVKKAEAQGRRPVKMSRKGGFRVSRHQSSSIAESISSDVVIKTDSMLDLFQLQKDLEEVWRSLKMPLEQKIDMAIRYSSLTGGIQLEQSAAMWKKVSLMILERELLIEKLEHFEREASNPKRFFDSATKSSELRMTESRLREDTFKDIQDVEKDLLPMIEKLRTKYKEIVTYEGEPYEKKMKEDYSSILHRLEEERKLVKTPPGTM